MNNQYTSLELSKKLKNYLYQRLVNKYNVTPVSQTRGIRKCNTCSSLYEVKFADLKRGWGKNCSKSCACIAQGGYAKMGIVNNYDGSWDAHNY